MHVNAQTHTHMAMNTEDGNKETNIKHYILPKCCCCSYQLALHWFTARGRTHLYKPQRHHKHSQILTNVCIRTWKSNSVGWKGMEWTEGARIIKELFLFTVKPECVPFVCIFVCLCALVNDWRREEEIVWGGVDKSRPTDRKLSYYAAQCGALIRLLCCSSVQCLQKITQPLCENYVSK